MPAFGSGPAYGEATEYYTASVAGALVETELIADGNAERAKARYLQGITMKGANIQELRITGPPATFNGESLHFLGKRDVRVQQVRYDFPVQMLLPDEEDLRMFAKQDAVGAETNTAILHYTYAPIPGKPIGFFYSQLSTETIAVGSSTPQDLAQRKTAGLGQGNQTLLGMQLSGEGQGVNRVNLRSTLWGQYQEDEFQSDNGPWAPGSNANFDSDGLTYALGEWKLSDTRAYTPAVIADAGDLRLAVYWLTERVPQSA